MQNGYAWLNQPPYVSPIDEFLIVNTLTNKIAQGCVSKDRAQRDCQSLNDHEIRNDRPACYEVRPNTRPTIFA